MGFYKKPLPGKAFTILFHLALSQVLHQHTQVYTRNYEKIITTDLPPFEGTRQPLVFFFSQLGKKLYQEKKSPNLALSDHNFISMSLYQQQLQ